MGTFAAWRGAAAALLLPSTALAATTEIGSAQGTVDCTNTGLSGVNTVQVTSSGDSYTVPAGGTSITSWTIAAGTDRSEEHTSELQSHLNLVCRLLLEKKNNVYIFSMLLDQLL